MDTITMYSQLDPENRIIRGKNVREIHDTVRIQHAKERTEQYRFTYTQEEKKLEDVINGTAFFLPEDSYELVEASFHLHNCVRSYASRVASKTTLIILMERAGNLTGCIEIRNNLIVQAYAPCNYPFPKEDYKVFSEWRSKHALYGEAAGWCGCAE